MAAPRPEKQPLNLSLPHPWNVTYEEAVSIQNTLKKQLILHDRIKTGPIHLIAGADISYGRNSDLFFATVVLLSYPDMQPIEKAHAIERASFPYIPGLLSFREGPVLLKAFKNMMRVPDLIIFDGQGIAHPRGVGLAAHMGLFLDIPAIGCAKSRLCGEHREPGPLPGDHEDLLYQEQVIGSVLRTKARVRPVFVSPGHLISLERSREVTLKCCRGYRLPEPIRQAHLAVNRLRISYQ
ncbi:MAG: deoxyribonuclease V [Syntrophales bacterium]|jgi:deoxyribonuclease V|nr:deoxyribonuclease V [Syntrophales bacterium]MCK9390403.1 deoxyribonuclease V [Syntrophales bacterium]